MTQQPDEATPRIVKKVVKKTVVRPVTPTTARAAAPSSAPSAGPRQRPARPAIARAEAPRTAATVAAAPAPPQAPIAAAPQARAAATQSVVASPTRRMASLPKPDIRGRASDLGHGVGDRVGDFGRGIGHAFSDGVGAVQHRILDAWDWLVGLRLPHLSPPKGSAIAGVIVGLLCVASGWGFYALFDATLGTQAGGGWGFLAFVFLSFVAFIVGELLLSGFGVPHARVVSILSVLLVLLMVLVFFIKLAAGVWAWLLIPTLFALSFVASNAVMGVATKEENPQRLPWEPTDESQVRTD